MANPNPKREAIDVVVNRAMRLPGGYALVHQAGEGACSWHMIIAVHPTTDEPLKDSDGVICERFRPIIGEE